MRLVADDEVPLRGGAELGLEVVAARELVHARDQQVVIHERVARVRPGDHVAAEDLEREPELLLQFVLPLVGEAPRRDDEAALEIAAQEQLLDQEPRHDGLAGAWIVGEQEPERQPRKHLLIDRADLVR